MPRRGLGCLIGALGLLALLGVLGALTAGLVGGGGSGAMADRIVEISVEISPDPNKKLAIIEVGGVLMGERPGLGGSRGATAGALAMLEHAVDDDEVGGVLLRLDTPGGSVTDADLIHDRVRALRERGKKVVVLMGDLCASGGYYVAVAADAVWAHPTTITGSIGVIVPVLNFHALLERYGVVDASVYAGKNKPLLSPTRQLEPAQQAIVQAVVDRMHRRFIDLVAEGRGIDAATVEPLADGRIFTADQALEAGLVDAIGYRDDAMTALRKLVDAGPYTVVRYAEQPSLIDLLRVHLSTPSPKALVWGHLFDAPRAMYLFAPTIANP